MRKLQMMTVAMAAALMLTACGTTTEPSTKPAASTSVETAEVTTLQETEQPTETAVEVTLETTEETTEETTVQEVDWYESMLDASLVSAGNNYRLKRVLEKARSGETVNMAILGGSITEGAGAGSNDQGYAYQFADAFAKEYCTGELNYVNAGVSGTPSALGVMRYQRDVVDALGTAPDLLVIEFAVNDWQEATKGRAIESLIYRGLTDNEDCAVILLFSVSKGKWNVQNDMKPYGSYYGIPMVSLLDALASTTEISDDKYFSDEYHPKKYGHTIMSDCLMHMIANADAAETNKALEIPKTARDGRTFANMTMIESTTEGIALEKGGFTAVDGNVQTVYKKGSCFPNNFMKDGQDNSPMKLTVTCQSLLLDYKTANDKNFGSADIYVDGNLVMTVEGNSAGGWNNNNVVLVIDEREVAEHTVEIKMADGSEDKKFTVLTMAYQ